MILLIFFSSLTGVIYFGYRLFNSRYDLAGFILCFTLMMMCLFYFVAKHKKKVEVQSPTVEIIKQIDTLRLYQTKYRTKYIQSKAIHDSFIQHIHDTIRLECIYSLNLCDSVRLVERMQCDSLISLQDSLNNLNSHLVSGLQSELTANRDTITDLRKPKPLKKLATRLKHFAQDVVLVGSGYVVYRLIK